MTGVYLELGGGMRQASRLLKRALLLLWCGLGAAACFSFGGSGNTCPASLCGPCTDSPGELSCGELVRCEIHQAHDCSATCEAVALRKHAMDCAANWCLATNGVGTRRCGGNLDALIDPSTDRPGVCQLCLANARARLFGRACVTPDSPDCNPLVCAKEDQFCLTDTSGSVYTPLDLSVSLPPDLLPSGDDDGGSSADAGVD